MLPLYIGNLLLIARKYADKKCCTNLLILFLKLVHCLGNGRGLDFIFFSLSDERVSSEATKVFQETLEKVL